MFSKQDQEYPQEAKLVTAWGLTLNLNYQGKKYLFFLYLLFIPVVNLSGNHLHLLSKTNLFVALQSISSQGNQLSSLPNMLLIVNSQTIENYVSS